MDERFKARREGSPDVEMTLDEYWDLPEPALSETSLFMGDGWVRPARFIGGDGDILSGSTRRRRPPPQP